MQKKTEILRLIKDFAAANIKDVSSVEYLEGDDPLCFYLKTKSGQNFTVFVIAVSLRILIKNKHLSSLKQCLTTNLFKN